MAYVYVYVPSYMSIYVAPDVVTRQTLFKPSSLATCATPLFAYPIHPSRLSAMALSFGLTTDLNTLAFQALAFKVSDGPALSHDIIANGETGTLSILRVRPSPCKWILLV